MHCKCRLPEEQTLINAGRRGRSCNWTKNGVNTATKQSIIVKRTIAKHKCNECKSNMCNKYYSQPQRDSINTSHKKAYHYEQIPNFMLESSCTFLHILSFLKACIRKGGSVTYCTVCIHQPSDENIRHVHMYNGGLKSESSSFIKSLIKYWPIFEILWL